MYLLKKFNKIDIYTFLHLARLPLKKTISFSLPGL